MPWQRRRLLLAEAITRYRPDLVMVDGRALDEKVIERTERDRRTYYRPAPF